MKAPKSVQVAKASMSDESKSLEVVARKAHDDYRDKKISAEECDKAVEAFNSSLSDKSASLVKAINLK